MHRIPSFYAIFYLCPSGIPEYIYEQFQPFAYPVEEGLMKGGYSAITNAHGITKSFLGK